MTDERYKQLMEQVGIPNSRSLLGALQQVANEVAQETAAAEREACAKIVERYEPDEKLDYVDYASNDIRSRSNVEVTGVPASSARPVD